MEYSEYKIEQIMKECRNYQQLCDIFLELTSDIEVKVKLKEILYKGGYNGFSVSSKLANKDNPFIEAERRISMAYLLIKNPITFEIMVQNQLNLFHGTNANALPNILKYGLNSVDESKKINIDVTTGEKWSRIGGSRNFVSFTDVLDIAEGYSSLKPNTENNLLSFGVLVCTTSNDVLETGLCRIKSDVSEVGVNSRLPLEKIRAICVPTDKVDFVRKILNDSEIKVLATDIFEDKFYYIDIDNYSIEICNDELEKIKNNLHKKRNSKIFKTEEVEKIMLSRHLTRIKEKLGQINSFITGGRQSNVETKHR